jgi:hypothetical protein
MQEVVPMLGRTQPHGSNVVEGCRPYACEGLCSKQANATSMQAKETEHTEHKSYMILDA